LSAHTAYNQTFKLLQEHHKWFQESIPLIASENVSSPAVREALASDFGHRYAEGWPGERVYAGCLYIDQVELLCIDLMKKLFKAEFVDVRPISGVVANLVVYTAFTEPGDVMMALSIPCGGHITTGKKRLGGTAGAVSGLDVQYLALDYKELNIDVDETKKRVQKLVDEGKPPKLVMFGASVFPFPHPVKELTESAREYGAHVGYDGSHVMGLIAGKRFQDPLKEGADALFGSTHKTFFGPQGGMILAGEECGRSLKNSVYPAFVDNAHWNRIAALAMALAEMKEFGKEYATQVINNAKTLAQALHDYDFPVVCPHLGFTQSHQLILDYGNYEKGRVIAKKLEQANIITDCGVRIGTCEVTRRGMKENEMLKIAEIAIIPSQPKLTAININGINGSQGPKRNIAMRVQIVVTLW